MPSDINASRHFYGAFGHNESEISAAWIVRFFQKKGTWGPLVFTELQKFYTAPGHRPEDETFLFNELVPRFIEKHGAVYYVTTEFISNCYRAAPANPQPCPTCR